jgi:putative ABC transport system permease protein
MSSKRKDPQKFIEQLLEFFVQNNDEFDYSGTLRDLYNHKYEKDGKLKADLWIWKQILCCIFKHIFSNLSWGIHMFKNYLKIALRNIVKNKSFSFINIAGLSVAVVCWVFIFLYISEESSYDNFHKDGDRVYRVTMEIRSDTRIQPYTPIAWPVAPVLKENFPQVENAVRLYIWGDWLVRHEDKAYYETRFMWADPEVFEVLTFPFLKGDPRTALQEPSSIVISERLSRKYFGPDDPIGRNIQVNDRDYMIKGVIHNPPKNSHLKYDLIASLKTIENPDWMSNWYGTECYTYIKLAPETDVEAFAKQISNLADRYIKDYFSRSGYSYAYYIQPIRDIHLHSNLQGEIVPMDPPGNPLHISIFSWLAIFIVLIACINFVNLKTARSTDRAKEIGMRKVIGAHRSQLINQFLVESMLISLFAICAALLIVVLLLPYFNEISGKEFTVSRIFSLQNLAMMAVLGLLAGTTASSYPAFIMSAFKPTETIKGILGTDSKGIVLRRILIVGQFAISAIVIIGTLVVYRQLDYMKNRYLGFSKDQKLIIPIRENDSLINEYVSIKDEFIRHPAVLGTAFSSHVPGRGTTSYGTRIIGGGEPRNQGINQIYIDADFLQEYDIEMAAGRMYQNDMRTDVSTWDGNGALIINEAAVRAFGWQTPAEAICKRISTGYGNRTLEIIGVSRDFHYKGLQSIIEPLIMEYFPHRFKYVSLRISIKNVDEAVSFLKEKWKERYPSYPFEYFFLDADFNNQYKSEEKTGRIIGIFSILGIIIACLGLLGLTASKVKQRTKELSIRKVLGASVMNIEFLLLKDFVKWVAAANLIAWPFSYYLMNKWLNHFAYRINLSLMPFIVTLSLSVMVALATIGFQTIKAATANPADSLRYE